jgi:uncharacterized Tic20 family protein
MNKKNLNYLLTATIINFAVFTIVVILVSLLFFAKITQIPHIEEAGLAGIGFFLLAETASLALSIITLPLNYFALRYLIKKFDWKNYKLHTHQHGSYYLYYVRH